MGLVNPISKLREHLKRKDVLIICCSGDEPQKHHAERKEPDTKEQLLHDSVYVRHPKEANPWSQKADW